MSWSLRGVGLVALLALVACGASSSYMNELEAPRTIVASGSQATVVFVRPSAYGKPYKHTILDHHGRFLGQGWGETYFAATMAPGEYTFIAWNEGTHALKATVEAGKTYYVKVDPTMGGWSPVIRLFALRPQHEEWSELAGWLADSTMLALSRGATEAFQREKGEDREDRILTGLTHYREYEGEDLRARTLMAADGVDEPVPVSGAVTTAAMADAPPDDEPPDAPAESGEGDDRAVAATAGGGCGADTECKGDRICRDGQCVDPSARHKGCEGDQHCRAGRVCRQGACVDPPAAKPVRQPPAAKPVRKGCKRDADCKAGRACQQGRCVAAAPVRAGGCARDRDCKGSRICHRGQCAGKYRDIGRVPESAGGFNMGATLEATQQACSGAGLQWDDSGKRPTCSGLAASIGFPATARFKFCDGVLCIIELRARPAEQSRSAWTDGLAKLLAQLERRYGHPAEIRREIPHRCHKKLDACLLDGQAKTSWNWQWSGKRKLLLFMRSAGDRSFIGIKYIRPKPPKTKKRPAAEPGPAL